MRPSDRHPGRPPSHSFSIARRSQKIFPAKEPSHDQTGSFGCAIDARCGNHLCGRYRQAFVSVRLCGNRLIASEETLGGRKLNAEADSPLAELKAIEILDSGALKLLYTDGFIFTLG